ncbi:VC0807 family protein [Nonomuraea sp. NPDC050547]|uniref:VC0807 family protein n=1 Tax=unclassified Nonomuraea TaxID=2593643 RepID=UPI0037BBAC5D
MTLLVAPPAPTAFVLPRMGTLLLHAAPRVLESMILPVALFYAGMLAGGEVAGMAASAAWVFGGMAVRLVRGQPMPGTVILAAVGITARVVVALAAGDVRWFFLPPTCGVFAVSLVFLATARGRRPLAERITLDLVPLPGHVAGHPVMRRFFVRQSLAWGCAQLLNGTLTLWILLSQSIGTFLALRTSLVALLMTAMAVASVLDFRRCLRALQLRA